MPEIKIDARDQLRSALESGVPTGQLDALLDSIDSAELLHAMFLLDPDEQRKLLSSVSAEKAANLVEDLPDSHTAELMEEMTASESATILEELASDHRVDILAELDSEDADMFLLL